MKANRALELLLAILCCGCPLAAERPAAPGPTCNGGSWTNAGNWNAGIIADGSGSTANFTTLSLPADISVTLDGARTIGNLSFDDQNTTKHNWSINAGSGGVLTLAGTISRSHRGQRDDGHQCADRRHRRVDQVRRRASWCSGGANTYTGTTTVSAGTLGLASATFSAASPFSLSAPSAGCRVSRHVQFGREHVRDGD